MTVDEAQKHGAFPDAQSGDLGMSLYQHMMIQFTAGLLANPSEEYRAMSREALAKEAGKRVVATLALL